MLSSTTSVPNMKNLSKLLDKLSEHPDFCSKSFQNSQKYHDIREFLTSTISTDSQDSAAHTYQKLFQVSPNELEGVYKEAYQAYLAQEYASSSFAFQWLVVLNPFISKFWLALGASLHMEYRLEEALNAYAITALLREKDPYPHYYAYTCYQLLKQPQEALKALKIAYKLTQHNPLYEDLREELSLILSNPIQVL